VANKDTELENIETISKVYHYHLSEIDRLRERMSEMIIKAHKQGASDREVAKCTSLSRARIQQIRTGK